MTLEEKKQQLAALIDEYTKQVDSALLAWWAGKYAAKNQRKVYGVTFDTVLHPAADLEAARPGRPARANSSSPTNSFPCANRRALSSNST